MLAKNWMSGPVITIDANDSIERAIELMKDPYRSGHKKSFGLRCNHLVGL
jgi:predicted transcriptional regulator